MIIGLKRGKQKLKNTTINLLWEHFFCKRYKEDHCYNSNIFQCLDESESCKCLWQRRNYQKLHEKCLRKMIISKQARKYERDTNVIYIYIYISVCIVQQFYIKTKVYQRSSKEHGNQWFKKCIRTNDVLLDEFKLTRGS